MISHWILLTFAIIAEVFGTVMLKYSEGFTYLAPTLGALCAFALAFYLESIVTQSLPVGITYAIWAGLGIVLTALVAWVWMGQALDTPAIIGMSMIVGGVVVMSLFSQSSVH